jgi:hypothetical protein
MSPPFFAETKINALQLVYHNFLENTIRNHIVLQLKNDAITRLLICFDGRDEHEVRKKYWNLPFTDSTESSKYLSANPNRRPLGCHRILSKNAVGKVRK